MPPQTHKAREYLIDLHLWRSAAALVACIITLLCTSFAIGACLVNYTRQGWAIPDLFRYFTTLSNLLTALAAAFLIPYAVTGIRRKRFAYPKWLSILHCTGTICTTLTMLVALCFILPFDRDSALGGSNLYLHVICPAAVLISFMTVESGYQYSRRDGLLCLLPFLAYSLVYLIMVVVVGKERGGWEDLYRLVTFVPFYVSLPLTLLLGYGVDLAVRTLSNRLTRRRQQRLLGSWQTDLEPVELKIELFGLGRFYGLHGEPNDLSIPYDILEALSERYAIPVDELMRPYTKGLSDGIREKLNRAN